MKQDQKSPTGLPSSKTVNSHDGWAHIHKCDGYKTFYEVSVHHFTGEVEVLEVYAHHSDAVARAMLWNEGKCAG